VSNYVCPDCGGKAHVDLLAGNYIARCDDNECGYDHMFTDEPTHLIRHAGPTVKEVRTKGNMSEIITSAENVSVPTETPKTTEQHTKDLAVWLKERGLTLTVVAQGRVTNVLCPIEDFQSPTHVFIPILAEAK